MMKNLILLACLSLFVMYANAQSSRVMTWSIGTPEEECPGGTTVCFPLEVAINQVDSTLQLATSTMRIFYDAGLMSNLQINNVEPGHSIGGLSESADVYGDVFGTTGGGGVFVQFNILEADPNQFLNLTTTPTHVLDFCFDIDTTGGNPYCTSIIFDNNHCGWGDGLAEDDGYLMNDAGIVGLYYVDGDFTDSRLADDEVNNYLWDTLPGFDCTVDMTTDVAGASVTTNCLVIDCMVVPVELLSFRAKKGDGQVDLTWTTATEINNDFFDVQRSLDGKEFRNIGQVDGKGTTFATSNYTFIDKAPLESNYYRLRQVDFDGTESYSNIRFVAFDNEASESKYEIYPNPFTNDITIDLGSVDFYRIEIYNSAGSNVLKDTYLSGQLIKLNHLASGSYTLKVFDAIGNEILVRSIVKVDRS